MLKMGRAVSIGKSFKQALTVPGIDERAEDERENRVLLREVQIHVMTMFVSKTYGRRAWKVAVVLGAHPLLITTVSVDGPTYTATQTKAIQGLSSYTHEVAAMSASACLADEPRLFPARARDHRLRTSPRQLEFVQLRLLSDISPNMVARLINR